MQVTIDGDKDTHNVKRPLKNPRNKNYERILENLARIPDGIRVAIKLNLDKKVAARFSYFLDDLQRYQIWPQRYDQFVINFTWVKTFEEANEDKFQTSDRLTYDEFFDVENSLRAILVSRFNDWAVKNGAPKGKLKWRLPIQFDECSTFVSPYSLVFDPEGYVHKCWESVHDTELATTNAIKEWDIEDFSKHMSFDRSNFHPKCSDCKYLPICDTISCNYRAINDLEPDCTYWKTKLEGILRDQYLFMKDHPDLMVAPDLKTKR